MPASDALVPLRSAFAGRLVLPDDDDFDDARRPWNRAIEQHPAAVAVPADVSDLRLLLNAARDGGFTVAVQPSGHGASGDLTGALLVRMDAFDDLVVDTESHTLTVGAGVRWGRVVDALEGSGWAAPAGSSPVVTAAGYTLGGGHSWFSRTAGLGSDNLRAAWLLRPDGTHERVDDDTDADVMWALRGAGGVVGIVTRLEIDLVRTPAVWGAMFTFAAEDSASVIRAVRDLAEIAPSSLNLFVTSSRMPDSPQLPEHIRGRSFVTVQALSTSGDPSHLLAGVRSSAQPLSEATGPSSPGRLVAQSLEPTEPTPSRGSSAALSVLDDATIDAIVDFHRRPENESVIGIELRMLGGALREPRRPGFASLASAGWLVYALAPLFPGAPAAPGDASLTAFAEVVAPSLAERTVPTFLSPGMPLDRASTHAELARLRAIRDRVDPDGLLHEGRLRREA